jgi:hypothetical protein
MKILPLPLPASKHPTTDPQLPCSANCFQDNSYARTTQETQPLLLKYVYCTIVDPIENTVSLLLRLGY